MGPEKLGWSRISCFRLALSHLAWEAMRREKPDPWAGHMTDEGNPGTSFRGPGSASIVYLDLYTPPLPTSMRDIPPCLVSLQDLIPRPFPEAQAPHRPPARVSGCRTDALADLSVPSDAALLAPTRASFTAACANFLFRCLRWELALPWW